MREPIPFGRYLLLDRVAVGGTAEVFAARVQEGEGRGALRAVKRLLPHLAEDPLQVARFLGEGELARCLACPTVVAVLELGQVGSIPYLALEWVPGRDLHAVQAALRRGGGHMPVGLAVLCAVRILEALAHAHAHAHIHPAPAPAPDGGGGPGPCVIHADLSPSNVLVAFTGEVKVSDFAGRPGGKIAYQPPEVRGGGGAGPPADVYAAAAVLRELISGGGAGLDIEVPPEVDRLARSGLAPLPADRPAAGPLADALRPWAGDEAGLSAWLCGLFPEEAGRERERLLGR